MYVPSFRGGEDTGAELRSSDGSGAVRHPASSGFARLSVQQQFPSVLRGGCGAGCGFALSSGDHRGKEKTDEEPSVLLFRSACHAACHACFFRRSVCGGDPSESFRAAYSRRGSYKRTHFMYPRPFQPGSGSDRRHAGESPPVSL